MRLADPYCKCYPVTHMCDKCGEEGAQYSGTYVYVQRGKLRPYGKHYSQGRCGICGFEGRVATPWVFGFPTLTNYLWGPDFKRIKP